MCRSADPVGSPGTNTPSVSRRKLLRSGATIAGGALTAVALGPTAAHADQAVPTIPDRGAYLVLLGTRAGPPIQLDRTGTASALVVDGVTYVIDCGRSATTQYVRAGLRLASLRAIFLTHLHSDHVADYYNFFLLGGNAANTVGDVISKPVAIYGPGRAGALPPAFDGGDPPTIDPADPTPGLADLTQSCHDAYAYNSNVFIRDSGLPDIRTLMDVTEIGVPDVGARPLGPTAPPMATFPVMADDRVRVTAILVPHGPVFPSFAFRFDTAYGSVTFSGDTMYSDNVISLAHGSDLLVHEAINLQGASLPPALYDHMLQSHTDVQRVGSIAEQAGVPRLVLSHIGDLARVSIDVPLWQHWAQQGFRGHVTVGDDLQRFPITQRRR